MEHAAQEAEDGITLGFKKLISPEIRHAGGTWGYFLHHSRISENE